MKNIYRYILTFVLGFSLMGVNFMAHAQDEPDTDAIKVAKEIIKVDDDGNYKIHLETFVTGSSVTTITETVKPVDLVLVLDVSSSMINNGVSSTTEYAIYNESKVTYNNYKTVDSNNEDYRYESAKYALYNGQYYKLDHETSGSGPSKRYFVFISVNGDKYYLNGSIFNTEKPAGATTGDGGIGNITVYEKRTKTRLLVLKEAVTAFVNQVKTNSVGKGKEGADVDHRIAIVSFEKHEHYITGGAAGFDANKTDSDYSDNFISVLSNDDVNKLINYAQNLTVGSGTRQDRGVMAANHILDANPRKTQDTGKVIVVFTDGEPFVSGTNVLDDDEWSGTGKVDGSGDIRNAGVEYSYKSKQTFGAKVFDITMGTLDGDNANFMEYMSSNYPKAKSMTNTGDKESSDYNFVTDDGSGLQKIFEKIADSSTQGGETYPLDAETTSVIDVVSDNFLIPDDVVVTIWHESCYGVDTNGDYLWAKSTDEDHYYSCGDEPHLVPDPDNPQKVKVAGFNYAADDEWNKDGTIKSKGNWVGPRKEKTANEIIGYWGNKVVIEFPVKVNPDYEGGYAMPSNDITSGVYHWNEKTGKEENIKPYPVPTVNFPSICIMKDGMAIGETALFEVKGPEGSNLNYTVSLIQRGDKNGKPLPCYVILKELVGGVYTVTEKNWTWLYNVTPTTRSIEQTVISAEMMKITVQDILDAGTILKNNNIQVGMKLSKTTTVASGAEAGTYPHTFVVLCDGEGEYDIEDLQGSAISLLYHFTNTRATEGKAPRAESYAHNEFNGGKNQGGTEYGGNEEEDI